MIEVNQISAGYESGKGPEVLKDITAVFRDGTVTALIGPNGCGKSTLLRAIAGMLDVSTGSILFDGTQLRSLTDREIARRVAYLPQSRPVPQIRAKEMVLHGRFPYLSFPRKYSREDRRIAHESLVKADAGQLEQCYMQELSGGQRQKVYIAMALAQETKHILLDEPTTYLDIRHQYEVMELCRAMAASGKSVIMVVHDLIHALQYADRILMMEGGEIRAEGKPEEIAANAEVGRIFGVQIKKLEGVSGVSYMLSPL